MAQAYEKLETKRAKGKIIVKVASWEGLAGDREG